MMKKSLWTGLLAGVMLCFLFQSTATASRIALTLGWHNLMANEFYLMDTNAGDSAFATDSKITKGLLKGSVLNDPLNVYNNNKTIELGALGFEASDSDVDAWKVNNLRKKFRKKINRKTNKAWKKAAINQQRSDTGEKSGWKKLYKDWKSVDIWTMYQGPNKNEFVTAAVDEKLVGMKFKGTSDGQKFKAYLKIFANSAPQLEKVGTGGNAVPEPATMLLFGLGLLGLAGVSRKKLK